MPPVAQRYLVMANVVFVLGGAVAYAGRLSLALMTCISLVFAVAGLWYMRMAMEGATRLDADRALSYASGTWAVLFVLIVLPYITIDSGESLWSSPAYAMLGVAVASLGVLLWNAAALRAIAPATAAKTLRMYVLFHAFVVALAAWQVTQGDGTILVQEVRGVETTAHDLQVAPALAAAPGVLWLLALLQRPTRSA